MLVTGQLVSEGWDAYRALCRDLRVAERTARAAGWGGGSGSLRARDIEVLDDFRMNVVIGGAP